MKTEKQAAADLAQIVPHLHQAAKEVKEKAGSDSRIQLAIIAKRPDGSGQIGAAFDCDEFLSDLALVFPFNEGATDDAAATSIVHRFAGRQDE
jgi:hypothetical protein